MSWEAVIPPLTHQSIRHVPNICNICNGEHYTGLCSSLSEQHIPDKPYHDNLSRYSVPDGLLIVDCEDPSSCIVVTAQKFAKGTRFGPLLAPKSYTPPANHQKFPLIIFNEVWNSDPILDELGDEIKELFNVRNLYLDTSDEHQCNWMIHVEIAKSSQEQNLMAYQENDQIYYTSTRDIEIGDIFKVWYSPSYALRMGVGVLEQMENPKESEMNFYGRNGIDYGMNLMTENLSNDAKNNNYIIVSKNMSTSTSSSEITLPPINSIMKTPSPIYNRYLDFEQFIPHKDEDMNDINYMYEMNLNDRQLTSSAEPVSTASSNGYMKTIKFTEMHDNETQKFTCETCGRKYITKSNLEKHMRSHDLFMCIICMKMFGNPEELRGHDCFKQKASAKKSLLHCSICWKVLSNAWSLNRHMKIHRANEMARADGSMEKCNESPDEMCTPPIMSMHYNDHEIEKQLEHENSYEEPHQSYMQQHVELTSDMLVGLCCSGTDSSEMNDKPGNLEYENEISSHSATTESSHLYENNHYEDVESHLPEIPLRKNTLETTVPPNEPKKKLPSGRYDKCIVCARTFKNPNSLDKHLKNVHTVHIIKPELTTSIKKSSEYRRIVLNKKPIKENVAKALMSKLNKKNLEQQQKIAAENNSRIISKTDGEESQTEELLDKEDLENNNNNNNNNTIIIISNVEISPASNPQILQNYATLSDPGIPKLVPIKCAQNEKMATADAADGSPKIFIIDKSNDNAAPFIDNSKAPNIFDEEQHHCRDCEKVFPKKYQLKRHQDIHENLFYFCPYCNRAPVKARSSLRKHLAKDHPEHHKTWQTSSFLSTLLRKYEKVKNTSQNGKSKKCKGEPTERKEKRPYKKRNKIHQGVIETNENLSCFINNDEPLPQGSNSLDMDDNNQHQQILLGNLFLDPITIDEENNLIKYSLAGEDDFMSSNNGSMINNSCSIENYELSEFSSFKSSFDEIQEKLDAELEFNNEKIKWGDELNDDDDSTISSQCGSNLSSPETGGKSLFKHKKERAD